MVNYKDGGSISDRADLPYEQEMKLLEKQRTGELKRVGKFKKWVAAGLVFVILLQVLGIFPRIEIAYAVGAFILAAGAFIAQGNYAHIGIINSRMEVLATENAARKSTQSPPCERCENATRRNAATIEPE